jgi:hypothetical protein
VFGVLAIPALLLAAAAAPDTPSRYDSGPRQAISTARDSWSRSHVQSYSYTITRACFCFLPPVHVVVKNGRVISAKAEAGFDDQFSGKRIPREVWKTYLVMTVPELLTMVDAAHQDRTVYAFSTFDPKLGFPTLFSVLPGSVANTMMSDVDDGFVVSDFRVLGDT